jgi:autoinducer-2 kinase
MSDPLLVAIDIGTGSCRAAVFDPSAREVAIAQREYHHPELPGIPGSQVFDTAKNWQLICACTREALVGLDPDRVAAISATSMREGMVLYDASGREIWACPNVDARSAEEATELIRSGAADEIYRRGGDWVAITAPARLRWIARHAPETFAAVARIGMLGDWVIHQLSGEYATDPSLGSSSGLFNLADNDWSQATLALVGLDPAIVPPVVAPGTIVGSVTANAAAATGLRAGTPVVAGGADTQLGLVGIGAIDPGRFAVVGGTFWQQTMIVDQPVIDPHRRLRTLCHTEPGRWMIEGIGFYSGLTMRWFRDAFYNSEERSRPDAYALLEQEAATQPAGSNGLFGIFSNLMAADRWVHASPAFIGFDVATPARSGRAACVRAIEEAAAYVSLGHLRIAEEVANVVVEEVVFTGGGSKGTLWPQILADVLGIPVTIPTVKESTALGAAMYAAVGAGIFSDVREAVKGATFERTVEPDATAHSVYADLYQCWGDLYARLLPLAEAAIVRPLWRAPGS